MTQAVYTGEERCQYFRDICNRLLGSIDKDTIKGLVRVDTEYMHIPRHLGRRYPTPSRKEIIGRMIMQIGLLMRTDEGLDKVITRSNGKRGIEVSLSIDKDYVAPKYK